MVLLDKYHDEDELSADGHTDSDAPPSYETITTTHSRQPDSGPAHLVDEKFPRQPALSSSRSSSIIPSGAQAGTARPASAGPSQPNRASWLSMLSFTSSRTSKQVRQTVLALIRDLVLNAESPNLLGSCADACRTYGLDLSALLQQPFIERHSAIYWGILNRRDALLPSLLVHAAPLSQETISEIRLACLATSNQHLFQALRCQREPFTRQMTPLSKSPGADALVLGSMPADEVSIHEMEGQGAFAAEIRMNLWQKRMRVSGRVSVEFIARGRIWSLTFFSPSSTTRTATAGVWQVALCLLEHSPPTFVNSRLVVDLPPPPSNLSTSPASVSQASDLISLSPLPSDPSSPASRSPPPPSPPLSNKSKSKSKAPQTIEVRLKSAYRLAYRASDKFLPALDAERSDQKRWDWESPRVEQWKDEDSFTYTNAIVAPLVDGAGAELMYDNTPFTAADGTLHVRLEARLAKPDATDCVIC